MREPILSMYNCGIVLGLFGVGVIWLGIVRMFLGFTDTTPLMAIGFAAVVIGRWFLRIGRPHA